MTLAPGSRLGPYEILSDLGAGGMGEVYRARDTRLGRQVAVKVLPAEVASDPSRLKRFEKEARAASALNHPNIVTIYDIGSSDSISYIAMEKVEGKTLREVLFAGPLPVRKLLQIAAQIAEGLARAHEAGIVHRDLKPENVMVTKDGLVKILDFGLAKLTESSSGSDEASHLPTETGTSPGVVLGTVGYMSPEQASGWALDFRSDQFSFGSVLFEMGTGRQPFARKTRPETLTAIIREEPEPMTAVNPLIPVPLRWVVNRCLSKEPKERYACTDDLARDLRSLGEHVTEAESSWEPVGLAPRRRRLGAIVLAAAALVALAAGWVVGRSALGSAHATPSFQRLTFRRGYIWSARFAPDGQTIVYGAAWGGEPVALFSTRQESPESLRLPVPSADVLGISSTGEMAILLGRHFVEDWLSSGTLARMPLSSNAPREVLNDIQGADWSPDGEVLAVVRDVGGRNRLEFPMGKVVYETVGWVSHPRVSPKGDRVAFFDHPVRGEDSGTLALVDWDGHKTELAGGWLSAQGIAWRG